MVELFVLYYLDVALFGLCLALIVMVHVTLLFIITTINLLGLQICCFGVLLLITCWLI